jgi:SUN domain-containing protein 1/2
VAALAVALGPWLLAQPVFLEPGEIKDVMLRLGKVESQLRSVTTKLSGLASQKELDELQRKYHALEATVGQVELLAGGAREAEARLRVRTDQAERAHADLGRRIDALESSIDQKVAAAAERADGQAQQLQGAVEELEGRVGDHELLTRKTLDGWRGRPVLRREDLQAEMDKFAADRTGRTDWALYWAGGRVIDHSALWARPSDLYTRALSLSKELPPLVGGALTLALGTKVHSRASQWLLEPTAQGSEVPGHCLALRGSTGFVDVRLRARVRVDAISIEHIPRAIAYDTSSAPREFELTGWQLDGRQPSGEMREFGRQVYTIGEGASPIQVFDVQPQEVDVLRLQLLSNHGHQEYTCIYRLRVHGEPVA